MAFKVNMTETQLKAKVLRMIKKEFPKAWVYKTNDRFYSGIPDILICMPPNGRMIAIELKSHRGKVTPIQDYNLRSISVAGGFPTVCRSIKEVQALLLIVSDKE